MSDVARAIAELPLTELHFQSSTAPLKAMAESGWPSPTASSSSDQSFHNGPPATYQQHPQHPQQHPQPPQQYFSGPWEYQPPQPPQPQPLPFPPSTAGYPPLPPPPLEPLPIHQAATPRRAFDDELEADARMLREVLQVATSAPPQVEASALQILFVPPADEQSFVLPIGYTPTTAAKPLEFSVKSTAGAAPLPLVPTPSHREELGGVAADASLSFASLLKAELASAPMLHHVATQSRSFSTSSSPNVFSMGVAVPPAAAPSLAKKKRSGATRICKVEGCTKGIRSRGLCKAHGGGRRCTTPGCTTSDQGGGHCVLHGGGRRCSVQGCTKSAQWRGVCKMHGGARRCRYGNCTKNGQVKQGYCRMHHNLVSMQRQQQASHDHQQQPLPHEQQPPTM